MARFRYLTATAFLLVMGCSQSDNSAQDNEAVGNVSDNGMAADDQGSPEQSQEPPQLAQVPAPSAGLAPAAAAPLAQAAAVASEIEQAQDVERIAYDDGWAWRRNGQILRTASSDGRRVSYFRSGESTPYLVQDGDRAFAYSGGRVQRAYDGRGRAVQADPARRAEGEQMARQSSEQRTRAVRTAQEQPQRVQHGRGGAPNAPAAGASGPEERRRQQQQNDNRREGASENVANASRSSDRESRRAANSDRQRNQTNAAADTDRERQRR